ncbi:hypothetical protein H8N01_14420 [Streptomyces sp. AC536]|uniref:hypothetical protein n=1 Tax=Streptomyces buecherae TaxID=2763006 RepID=UPI00164D53C7|nr:hypothetical protein [Streptomyces buecherae]MBC3983723.1 hypothetical protein [Streptomyces buecherae]QNJ42470.1 hypothetical protein H7H31_24115 [Streptomyces buecherae]
MTAPALHFADAREAADLAAFLARLIHYDRAAAVRLQASVHSAGPRPGGVLAVFGRPASFEVLAIRTALLAPPPPAAQPVPAAAADTSAEDAGAAEASAGDGVAGVPWELDVTVSAGQFADAVDAARQSAGPVMDEAGSGRAAPGAGGPRGLTVVVPQPVTGPPWAGVLPPRGGWQRVAGLPDARAVRGAVAAAVAEFRARDEALAPELRTRAERDRIGREIWSRTLGETELPLRAAHAAQALGFLRPTHPSGGAATAAHPGSPTPPTAALGTGTARPPEPEVATVGSPTTAVAESPASALGAATAPVPPAATPVAPSAAHGAGQAGVAPGATEPPLVLFAARGWLRLRTPYGSIAVRTAGPPGLSVTPA